METIDPEKSARVWQRVQGKIPMQPDSESLLALIQEEGKDAAIYLHLSRRYQGKESAVLRRMAEQEQTHAACLKGIYTLITGSRPALQSTQPVREPLDVVLRRCYGREMRCLAQYEARASDPEYGQVFSRIAEQEREHCRMILELLGKGTGPR